VHKNAYERAWKKRANERLCQKINRALRPFGLVVLSNSSNLFVVEQLPVAGQNPPQHRLRFDA
jgi:hypothetical protein